MNNEIAIQNQPSVNGAIPSDKNLYQDQLHTKLVLAFVYANSLKTQFPCWRINLQTTEAVFPVDPRDVIQKLTEKPFPVEGRVTTVLNEKRPRTLTFIGSVYVECTTDALRRSMRAVDTGNLGQMADDLRTLRQSERGVELSGIVPAHVSEAMERMAE